MKRKEEWLYWGLGITGFLALVTFRPKSPLPPKPTPVPTPKSIVFQTEASGAILTQTAKDAAWSSPKLKAETLPKFRAMVENFQELVNEASLDYQVPISWLWAIMWAESQGYPQAKSKKGAIGLMQLMPYHFKPDETNPYDPQTNIRAGARFLQIIRSKVNTLVQAASNYNAGGPWTNETWVESGRNPSYTTAWGYPAERGYIDTVVAANNTFLSLGIGINS